MADIGPASLGMRCTSAARPDRIALAVAPVRMTGTPEPARRVIHGRVEFGEGVKKRLAEARRAYDNAIVEALAELADHGERSAEAIQQALGCSRATAYRYLQRIRKGGGSNA